MDQMTPKWIQFREEARPYVRACSLTSSYRTRPQDPTPAPGGHRLFRPLIIVIIVVIFVIFVIYCHLSPSLSNTRQTAVPAVPSRRGRNRRSRWDSPYITSGLRGCMAPRSRGRQIRRKAAQLGTPRRSSPAPSGKRCTTAESRSRAGHTRRIDGTLPLTKGASLSVP